MAARLDWIWDEDKKSMLKSCSSSGIRYLRSAPLSAQIISSFSPKISQICPKITFQCMSMLCKYYAFWEESREGFRRAASARGQLGDARRSVCRQIWSTQVQCAIIIRIRETVRRPLNALWETKQCATRQKETEVIKMENLKSNQGASSGSETVEPQRFQNQVH